MALAAMLLGAAGPAFDAQVWTQKKPEQWSKKDCEKVLGDSPWAKTWERSEVAAGLALPVRTTYVAQLWSVRAVRQAIVRNAQLAPSYRSLTPEQKKAQDTEGERFIAAGFPDTVVVQIVFGTNSMAGERDLRIQWQKLSLEALKETASLEGPRGRVAPVEYTKPAVESNEFQLVFPRTLNGQALVQEGDAFLRVEFVHPIKGILAERRVVIEFHPKDMLLDGKLVY
jgi:hypothetical protein